MQSVPSWKRCPRASARYGPSTIRPCYRKPRHSGRARRCRSAVTLRNGRRGLERSRSPGRPGVPRRMRNAMVQDASEIRSAVVAVYVLTLRTALWLKFPASSRPQYVDLLRDRRGRCQRHQKGCGGHQDIQSSHHRFSVVIRLATEPQGQASGASRRKSCHLSKI